MAYLGIDVSKKTLDCCLIIDSKEILIKVNNNEKGFYEILDLVDQYKINIHICLEATSSYWQQVTNFFYNKGFQISVENPAKIFYFSKAVLARAKTDKKDALLIAKYCQALKPSLYVPASSEVLKLKKLVDILKITKIKKVSETTRIKEASDDIKFIIEMNIKNYENQIFKIEEMLKEFFRCNPVLDDKLKKLESIPAVGFQTAAILLSILESHKFKNSSKFVAFLGLNPKMRESGTSVKGKERISKMGKSFYRSALFMPAMCAYSHNFYPSLIKNLKNKNKPTKIILIAIMRKIAVYAFIIHSKNCNFIVKES